MPTLGEFATALNMPLDAMVRIGEQQAVNPNSEVFKSIKLEMAKKLAAVKALSDSDARNRAKVRVYIHDTVSASHQYVLKPAFPNWDIRFTNTSLRAAPVARAIFSLTAEYLFEKVKAKRGTVLAWGTGIKSILLRARHWVHLCVPGHDMQTQYEFQMDDRAVLAIVNSNHTRGRDPGLARKYIEGTTKVHCVRPDLCCEKAPAAIMMLHKTDTNFRQLAYYMMQHGVKLLYFAIPGNKNMELCTQGVFSELDAYVNPTNNGARIDIVYKNESALNFSYDYTNYLELVARTEVRLGEMIFRKEFDNRFLGMLVYKVTAFPAGNLISSVPKYRSWIDPDYKGQYMVYAPVLKPHGTVSKIADWEVTSFPVNRTLIDDVHDAALRTQGVKDLAGVIQRRLNSKTSNEVVLNQIVQKNKLLAVSKFDLVALVIYCSVFMQRFKDGQAITTLAPHAREVAELGRKGVIGMLSTYLATVANDATSSLKQYAAAIRRLYYNTESDSDLPLPSFALEPGYVEYSDTDSSNPRFIGWRTPDDDPIYGFTSKLPGCGFRAILPYSDILANSKQSDSASYFSMDPLAIAYGEAIITTPLRKTENATTASRSQMMKYATQHGSAWTFVGSAVNMLNSILIDAGEVECMDSVDTILPRIDKSKRMGDLYEPQNRIRSDVEHDIADVPRFRSREFTVTEIVQKIMNDNNNLVSVDKSYISTSIFSEDVIPEIVPGLFSDDPVSDIRDGLNTIFPGSLLMKTMFFESDKVYGDAEHNLKTVKMKIDLSKMLPLKPESFFLPVISGHVLPDAKNNMTNVIRTMEKRNANTPDNTHPMDESRVIAAAWDAYLKVYCKPGTEQLLDTWNYIGPDERVVAEWVSRLAEPKKNKLLAQEGFQIEDLDLSQNLLMLKGKIKPNLSGSYETSVKMPQSIQYDASGKSTAVLSPVIGHKVEREQSVLKSNVLVLQRKSYDDIIKFLNRFDWRSNEQGERLYLEGDYEQYDKSQAVLAAKMHWHKLAKFGVMPNLVEFLTKHNATRSISALEAGIKMFIDHQRGSGHPDTLDGNNDVNEMAMAELLLQIAANIEFIILMGDDFIVAIRGQVDIANWEYEIARRYNLSIKLSIQRHGYICSCDIVHLPDGRSTLVADVIKRTLSFLSVSTRDENLFAERYVSYVDNMRYIDDVRVQQYLSQAIPMRIRTYLPGTTPESILLLCKANARLKSDFSLYRKMFAEVTTMRFY